jgi:hypothetical protein
MTPPNPWMAEYLDTNGAMLDPSDLYRFLYQSPGWRPDCAPSPSPCVGV